MDLHFYSVSLLSAKNMYHVQVNIVMFCPLIFPTRYYHLLCNGEDEDNDSSGILKAEGCAILYAPYYLVPTASLIVDTGTAFVLILEEGVRVREVDYLGHAHPAGEWRSPMPGPEPMCPVLWKTGLSGTGAFGFDAGLCHQFIFLLLRKGCG